PAIEPGCADKIAAFASDVASQCKQLHIRVALERRIAQLASEIVTLAFPNEAHAAQTCPAVETALAAHIEDEPGSSRELTGSSRNFRAQEGYFRVSCRMHRQGAEDSLRFVGSAALPQVARQREPPVDVRCRRGWHEGCLDQ